MINSAGVIFTYSPNQPQKTKSAGPLLSGNKQPLKQKRPVQQKQSQPRFQGTPPATKHVQPFNQHFSPSPKAPIPLKQPQPFPPRPVQKNPFPPLPPGFKQPFPQKPGTSSPSPWGDPFGSPKPRPPSPYAQAKSLQDLIAQKGSQLSSQEFHKGLPVEEIPEVVNHEPQSFVPTIDTTYVDKLFGIQSVPQQKPDVSPSETEKVGPLIINSPTQQDESKVGPLTSTTVQPATQAQNKPIKPKPEVIQTESVVPIVELKNELAFQQSKPVSTVDPVSEVAKTTQQIETRPELSDTKEVSVHAHTESVKPETIPAAPEPKQQPQPSENAIASETAIHDSEPKKHESIAQAEEATPQNALAPNFSQSHEVAPVQIKSKQESTVPVSPYMPEGLTAPDVQPSHVQKKQKHFVFPSLFGRKKTQEQTPVPEAYSGQTAPQQTAKAPSAEKHPTQSDVLKPKFPVRKAAGIALIALAILGLTVPVIPRLALEQTYAQLKKGEEEKRTYEEERPLPPSVPIGFNPMMAPDGTIVEPVNTTFSIVIPSVGINAPVLPGINPLDAKSYMPALKQGVAHAKTSYFPNQNGSVYLFSHSTNYEWFVNDLNAVFYNVKNLKPGEYIILFYEGKRYVYEYKESNVVSPKDTAELVPESGKRELILQTCWPPGSVSERLLLYADLIEG